MRTIRENPDLFQVPQRIRVNRLESLLRRHPNPPFVESVLTGLRSSFWPWMNTQHDGGYPETWDNSWASPPSDRERNFISSQAADHQIGRMIPSAYGDGSFLTLEQQQPQAWLVSRSTRLKILVGCSHYFDIFFVIFKPRCLKPKHCSPFHRDSARPFVY
ncbi:RNase H domain-containing protein [Mycena kentingensis (nom. inval.)]|nr:RNase H domain-containing protein [Mycena kentingensis (nom. inval.)]